MATGATARAVRDGVLLNAGHFLTSTEAAVYCAEVPKVNWFSNTTGSIGVGIVCVYLHAFGWMRENYSVGIR